MRLFNFRFIASVGSPKNSLITQEFIEIVKTVKQPKLLASLDVGSLFTNVPINDTLNIIIDFEEHSKLSFTYEIESCEELSFLDTILRRNKEQLRSAVYRKPTNIVECLNYNSICPNKYKTGVIKKILYRAYNICSDYTSLTTEIARIKQLLINNNFPNYLVDQVTKEFINKKQDNKLHGQNKRDTANTEQQNNQVEFYYQNQMTSNYKQVEKELTTIINSSIETTNEAKLKLRGSSQNFLNFLY